MKKHLFLLLLSAVFFFNLPAQNTMLQYHFKGVGDEFADEYANDIIAKAVGQSHVQADVTLNYVLTYEQKTLKISYSATKYNIAGETRQENADLYSDLGNFVRATMTKSLNELETAINKEKPGNQPNENSFATEENSVQNTNIVHPSTTPQKTERNIFLGLNGSLGLPMGLCRSYGEYGYYDYVNYFDFGLNLEIGVDFAYPLNDKFAIGAYLKVGPNLTFLAPFYGLSAGFNINAGVLALLGDIKNRPFILGFSPCAGFSLVSYWPWLPLEFRIGKILNKHLYITGNLNLHIPLVGGFMFSPSVTIGYHFGDKLKVKTYYQ